MKMFYVSLLFASLSAPSQELNTLLMNSTFEILGRSTEPGKINNGTVFVMGRPKKDDPARGYNVLITAAHVLDDISGDDAVLLLRRKTTDGSYTKYQYAIKIRRLDSNVYVKNADADVAAMYVNLPRDLAPSLLTTERLVDDAEFQRLEIHPGDELSCLGFPLFADANGFPILRSGKIASYPLVPAKTVKQYLYDFHVFPGNSGGPVYFSFSNRIYGGSMHLGETVQGVVGLVIQQENSTLPESKDISLNIGVVVPSTYIRETIALLPDTPPAETFTHINLPRLIPPLPNPKDMQRRSPSK
jgi:hypothetical protein